MARTTIKIVKYSGFGHFWGWLIAILTSMIGYHIHGSVGYAILNFFFWGISWIVWLVQQKVNLTIIKETFSFFFQ